MQNMNTHIDLVAQLKDLNEGGIYDALIRDCEAGRYHDFLKPADVPEPKVDLVRVLKRFPELKEIMRDVLNCEYDESANVNPPAIADLDITVI
jgi:selenophosphate synthetase-related protein